MLTPGGLNTANTFAGCDQVLEDGPFDRVPTRAARPAWPSLFPGRQIRLNLCRKITSFSCPLGPSVGDVEFAFCVNCDVWERFYVAACEIVPTTAPLPRAQLLIWIF